MEKKSENKRFGLRKKKKNTNKQKRIYWEPFILIRRKTEISKLTKKRKNFKL